MNTFKFLFSALLIFSCILVHAQSTPTTKVEEKDSMPPLRFYTASDSTLFTASMLDTTKPTLLFYFSTTCEFCEAMMKEIFGNKEKLKDINVLLVSGHQRKNINFFLSPYDTISTSFRILKDDERNMRKQFNYAGVPMIRIYDKNKKLLLRHEGRMTLDNIKKTLL